jgi:hypothetical protein
LAAYRSLRELLARELSIEPCAELQDLHTAILRGELEPGTLPTRPEHATAGVPRQLPAAPRPFLGRCAELLALTRLVDESRRGRSPAIAVIDGLAGIGKTSLAITFAHRVADHYPDGQLYVNLRGSHPGGVPLDPSTAVCDFLRALDVSPQRVPDCIEAQGALLRSILADRRVLMLLDNAHDADQVRPMLPGTAECLVLVTSRQKLIALHARQGACTLTLDLLPPSETKDLFVSRLGGDRADRDPDSADKIIGQCGSLPLALVNTAARAAARPRLPLAAIAAEIEAASSLDAFGTGDPGTDIGRAFSWSFSGLSTAAARLFRLLGLHPAPDISLAAAASLVGGTVGCVASQLSELARSHLITETAPHRYGLHSLMRLYAKEQVILTEDLAQRDAATGRLLDHYLHTAYAASRLVEPDREAFALPQPLPGAVVGAFSDGRQAGAWIALERSVMHELVRFAERAGMRTHAALLSQMCIR